MAHQSLYRVYRPKTFKEVVGQEQIAGRTRITGQRDQHGVERHSDAGVQDSRALDEAYATVVAETSTEISVPSCSAG